MKRALLIPIYEPNANVVPFLKSFKGDEFIDFLVVDDGSGPDYSEIFSTISSETSFRVLSYPHNRGKGSALKTGIAALLEANPDLDFIVTADGDGQHLYKDILAVADAAMEHPGKVILGSRDFTHAPKKSSSGNRWSARYFFLATQRKIRDCQTGLRALPSASFDMALHTYGDRFDYEMNFLLPASREFGFVEVTIDTVYIDGNAGTHFRPIADSLLIMRTPIIYILVGVSSFLIDMLSFYLFSTFVFTENKTDALQLLYCFLCSRAISFPYNYILLDKLVFHHKGMFHNSFWKYLLLAISSLFTGYGLAWGFRFLPAAMIVIKLVIDSILGIVKYFLNLMITFANRKFGRKKQLH